MHFFSRVVAGITLLGSVLAAQVSDPASERSKLIAFENAWNQAQIQRDGQALNTLIGDKFVYTDWDGTVMNKSRFIADIKDPSVETTLVTNDDVQVYLYPGAAVVTGTYHAKGKTKTRGFDHYGRFTDTWIRVGDQWQCVASHTNLLAHPPRSAASKP